MPDQLGDWLRANWTVWLLLTPLVLGLAVPPVGGVVAMILAICNVVIGLYIFPFVMGQLGLPGVFTVLVQVAFIASAVGVYARGQRSGRPRDLLLPRAAPAATVVVAVSSLLAQKWEWELLDELLGGLVIFSLPAILTLRLPRGGVAPSRSTPTAAKRGGRGAGAAVRRLMMLIIVALGGSGFSIESINKIVTTHTASVEDIVVILVGTVIVAWAAYSAMRDWRSRRTNS